MDASPVLIRLEDPEHGPSSASDSSLLTLQSRKRVRTVAAALAFAIALAYGLTVLYYDVLGWEASVRLPQTRFRLVGLFLLSVPMIFLAGWRRIPSSTVVDLGLGYQVAGAFVSSCSFYGPNPVVLSDFSGVTWLGVWILLFPLIAPAGALKNGLAALASASMAPLVYFAWVRYAGEPIASAQTLANMFVPNYFCAMLALFPAVILQRAGRRVREAERAAKEFGTYRLVELLGEGGMGEVWRADHKLLRRPAAIKLIRPERLRRSGEGLERTIARFEREANATALLRSPHTVDLYDFGVTPDGSIYCVMELLDGFDLEDFVRQHGGMPWRRAVHVLRQLAASLCEAHHVGMVHRDVKPANVFLCRNGLQLDFVKVLDFGLVDLVKEVDVKLTAEGAILGTPLYMAPEQVDSGGALSPATDVYAFGCLAFTLVTGRPVFQGKSAIEVLAKQVSDAPRKPSELTPGLPREFDELVLACLAKAPRERPQGMPELLERLEVLALEPWSPAEAAAWWEEHGAPPRPSPRPRAESEAETLALP